MAKPSQVDINVYLAELASDSRLIDPLLDRMRVITARKRSVEEAYTPNEQQVLEQVQKDLESHLVHDDPLRSFSYDSLNQKIYEHFDSSGKIRHAWWYATISAAIMAAITLVTLAFSSGPFEQRIDFAVAIGLAVGFLGLIYILMTVRQSLSLGSRQAMGLICWGIAVSGLYLMVKPFVFNTFHGDIPLFWLWVMTFPMMSGFFLLYLGFRKFGLLLGLRRWTTSIAPMVGLTALTAAALWLPFGLDTRPGAVWYGLVVADRWVLVALRLACIVILLGLLRVLQAPYREPFLWVLWGLIGIATGTLIEVVSSIVNFSAWTPGDTSPLTSPLLANALFIVSIGFCIRAGYAFNKLRSF